MRRLILLLLVALSVLTLGACGGPENSDPRLGRVYTEKTSCWTSCIRSWYVCVGPDLYIHVEDTDDKTIPNSPKCREDVG